MTYGSMPLKQNIPNGHENWKLTTCPECRRPCWKTDVATQAEKFLDIKLVCTECMLGKGREDEIR